MTKINGGFSRPKQTYVQAKTRDIHTRYQGHVSPQRSKSELKNGDVQGR